MASYRTLLFIGCMLAGLSLTICKLRTPMSLNPPPSAQLIAEKENALTAQLKEKGEGMLLRALGKPAHLTVTVRCSSGHRKRYLQAFPSEQGGRFGYAVMGIQEKSEKFCKDQSAEAEETAASQSKEQKSDYKQDARSEKREYSKLQVESSEYLWVERISVCAVVPAGDRKELEEALTAALGLDTSRGDSVRVTLQH